MWKSVNLPVALGACLIMFSTKLCAFNDAEHELAAKYFNEFAEFCKKGDGILWPIKSCRPTMFVDPASRAAMLNTADPEKKFAKIGVIYSGQLPSDLPIANTSIRWAGESRTVLIWPLATEQRARLALFIHESFHGIQDDLGLPSSGAANAHLDDEQARVFLRLEWRALARALLANDDKSRRAAILAALSFREKRFTLFSTAMKEEAAMEVHEGLAEYTGIALAYVSDSRNHAAAQLARGEKSPALSRSFAYFSGPAYGLLLDSENPKWRLDIAKVPDLAMMLRRSLRLETVAAPTEAMVAEYGGIEIRAEEKQRAEKQAKRISDIRARFVDGSTLRLPLKNMQFEMNPQSIFNMPDGSQYHETLKVRDDWGEILVKQGALIVGWKELRAVAPPGINVVETDAWVLKLKPGWALSASGASYQVQLITPNP
jgi:hypothetical protein